MTEAFARTPAGVRLFIRVSPGAGRNAIGGVTGDAGGRKFLRVMVTAAPEDGKANAAVVALLSKSWKVPKSAIRVVSGAANRRKTLEITGDTQQIAAAIARATEQ